MIGNKLLATSYWLLAKENIEMASVAQTFGG
jgi:hypothetical protein